MIIRLIGPRRSSLETLMLAMSNTVRDTGVQSVGTGTRQLTTGDGSTAGVTAMRSRYIANTRRTACACNARFSWDTTQSGTIESKPLKVAAITCNSVWT